MTAAFIAKAAEIKVAAVADILSWKLTPPGEMGAAVVLNYTTFWYSSGYGGPHAAFFRH
jgi:glycine cleavage system pyridoxal-binding protein P